MRVPSREPSSLVQAGLFVTLLVPAILAIYLFEALLGSYAELTLQQYRDLLPRAAKVIEENTNPANLLWSRFSKALGENRAEITRENAQAMADRARRALQVPANVYCFNSSGSVVFPLEQTSDVQEMETFYRGYQNFRLRRPLTPENLRLDRAAKQVFRKRFGRGNFLKLVDAMVCNWKSEIPGSPPRYIGYLPIVRQNDATLYSGIFIEVDDTHIPRSHLFEHGLRACNEQIGYTAFLASDGASIVAERFSAWFPRERLTEIPIST
ncbi:MAG TPA: hypothetical protein PKO06_11775, partial [Candidatus Ozemobacteraceae bacterium]|nr:hypothetical protein [Candidatus Ozemobacteraceae bacterium]